MHDDLDRLIDGALSAYSAAEPLAGLESRVLNRVRGEAAARRRRWLWAIAVPVLAAILIAVLVRKPQPARVARVVLPPVPVATVQPLPPPPSAVVRHAVPRPPAKARTSPSQRTLPKEQMFPKPAPLTKEERLLAELAESHPYELRSQPVDEIEIKPIQIAPLEINGGQ